MRVIAQVFTSILLVLFVVALIWPEATAAHLGHFVHVFHTAAAGAELDTGAP
jgi:flagellin-like protein